MSQLTPQEQQKDLLRKKSDEYPTLTDWQISELLNQPDSTLPLKIELKSRKVGPGHVMSEVLGDPYINFTQQDMRWFGRLPWKSSLRPWDEPNFWRA